MIPKRKTCYDCNGSGTCYRPSSAYGDGPKFERCAFCGGTGTVIDFLGDTVSPTDTSSPPPLERERKAFRPMAVEEGAANLLSIGVAVAIGYFGYNQTSLEWYWLLGGGVIGGLLTYKLSIGPFRRFRTLLRYIIIIGVLLAAAAFILNNMHQNP